MIREQIECKLVGADLRANTVELLLPNGAALGGAVIGQKVIVIAFVETPETEVGNTSTATCEVCGKQSTWGESIYAVRETPCDWCGRLTRHHFRADKG